MSKSFFYVSTVLLGRGLFCKVIQKRKIKKAEILFFYDRGRARRSFKLMAIIKY